MHKSNFRQIKKRTYSNNSVLGNNFRVIFYKKLLLMVATSLLIIIGFGTYSSLADNTLNNLNFLINNQSKLCLDVKNDLIKNNTPVDLASCNHTSAQNWSINLGFVKNNNYCLTFTGQKITVSSKVILDTCSNLANQVLLPTGGRLENPASNLCLSQIKNNLGLAKCFSTNKSFQNWSYYNFKNDRSVTLSLINCSINLSPNQKLACMTMMAWNNWNQPNSNHYNLLTQYTDNNAYEEWCADFVSYIYFVSGHPFTNGERNNWDEYNANNIMYQGFTLHQANSSYVPQAGDVAFFDYPGGHVEMVAIGGKTPTFIYGDSATIDSQTGNGDMAANNLLSDGNLGQVTYYLSPIL